MRWILKILFSILLTLNVNSFAQESNTPTPKAHELQTETDQSNFFDSMDTPVTYKGTFVKMMLTLLALVVLIVLSVWMLRRISHGRIKQMNYGRSIKVLERRPLSAKSILYLVEISGKQVVIAESQLEVRLITTADHLSEENL